jgi:hypothetical protein
MQPVYFIYKIACLNPKVADEYIGMTINLKRMMCLYKSILVNDTSHKHKVLQAIEANGGVKNWIFILIEMVITDDVQIARKKHAELIKLHNSKLNKMIPYTNQNVYHKEYYKANIQHFKERKRQYYMMNQEKIKERDHQKFNCECKGKYIFGSKARHFKTAKHQKYCASLI